MLMGFLLGLTIVGLAMLIVAALLQLRQFGYGDRRWPSNTDGGIYLSLDVSDGGGDAGAGGDGG